MNRTNLFQSFINIGDILIDHDLPTAHEGSVRIQYKCLVPIYVFPEMKQGGLVISKTELQCSVSQFQHSCICERFIYSQDWSAYFAAAK
jgi:hypothetical protein